jgi:hypothetical protein
MESENQAMQEGQSGLTLKKLGNVRADVKGTLLPAPSLQGGAGDLKLLGRLTLGDPLSLQLDIVLKPVSPLEPVPAQVTVDIVKVRKIKYRCHRGLPLKPWQNER